MRSIGSVGSNGRFNLDNVKTEPAPSTTEQSDIYSRYTSNNLVSSLMGWGAGDVGKYLSNLTETYQKFKQSHKVEQQSVPNVFPPVKTQ